MCKKGKCVCVCSDDWKEEDRRIIMASHWQDPWVQTCMLLFSSKKRCLVLSLLGGKSDPNRWCVNKMQEMNSRREKVAGGIGPWSPLSSAKTDPGDRQQQNNGKNTVCAFYDDSTWDIHFLSWDPRWGAKQRTALLVWNLLESVNR